jgi:predicted transcriptional regulator of viral defense system
MLAKNRRTIECGQVHIQFVARRDLVKTPVVEMNTPRGRMRVSSKEATVLEVVGYADQCGGLDNVASILSELVESVDSSKLLAAARLCPIAWSQRLGYLLVETGHGELAGVLDDHVFKHAKTVAPLVRAKPMTGVPRSARWRLAINESVEAEQ